LLGNFIIGPHPVVPGIAAQLRGGLGVSLRFAGLPPSTAFAATVCVGAPLLAYRHQPLRPARAARRHATALLCRSPAAAARFLVRAMVLVRMLTSVAPRFHGAGRGDRGAARAPEKRGPRDRVRLPRLVDRLGGRHAARAYVGAVWGWRAGFALVAAGALAGAAAVWLLVPGGLRVQPVNAAMWRSLLRIPGCWRTSGVTALFAGAGFTVLSYFRSRPRTHSSTLRPRWSDAAGCLRIAGVAGTSLPCVYMDRLGPARIITLALLAALGAHLLWP